MRPTFNTDTMTIWSFRFSSKLSTAVEENLMLKGKNSTTQIYRKTHRQ